MSYKDTTLNNQFGDVSLYLKEITQGNTKGSICFVKSLLNTLMCIRPLL